jgi:threonyl-tRNA synthetase
MINLTFPDGAVRSFEAGTTSLDVAKSISEGLARKVISSLVNNEVWDVSRPLTTDATIQFLTWESDVAKNTFWHSSAHLMAEAVEALYPGVKFWVGPALDKGFYYDMDLGDRKITEEDVAAIENDRAG